MTMLKLYKLTSHPKMYWETWTTGDRSLTVHWGVLGTSGQSKLVQDSWRKSARKHVEQEEERMINDGFAPINELEKLIIEFKIIGMGNANELERRHRLQDRMNETLGWTGLGHCDGGSIGSGTMEVCCMVVDYQLAENIVTADLVGTEFADFARVYREE